MTDWRNLRVLVIALLIATAAWYSYPPSKRIRLGLDLKGGMHLVLGVDLKKALDASLEKEITLLKGDLEEKKVDLDTIERVGLSSFKLKLIIPEDLEKMDKILRQYPELETKEEGHDYLVLALKNSEIKRIKENAINQTLEVIRNRIDQFGVAEPTISRVGSDRVLVQLPGIKDSKRAIKIIGKTARLEFKLMDEGHSVQEAINKGVPPGDEILYGKLMNRATGRTSRVPYLLKKRVLLTGDHITDARVRIDPMYNEPYVALTFDKVGAKIFARVTRENVKKRLAIILDKVVYSAPVIQEPIPNGRAQITGRFTSQEAHDLAIVLRAGALPAPVRILENRTVGPSLGRDSINKGVKAAIIGLILVLFFMVIYYRLSGVLADIALLINMVIITGALSAFGATLTLPGIAGIILTIGMSVDASVLIFERIREETRLGRTVRAAVDAGFSRAFITILDANVTTIIAALVLFQFGTGPVKGFAVTLSIGIAASMFTAIVFCKTVYDLVLNRFKIKSLSI
jgi:preprotein translocase subunit SecD